VAATLNIHTPLTAPLCLGTIPKIDSSNYTTQSGCLNSRLRKCVTLVVSTKRYLAAVQYKIREDYPG